MIRLNFENYIYIRYNLDIMVNKIISALFVGLIMIPVLLAQQPLTQQPLLSVKKLITPNSTEINDTGFSSDEINVNLTIIPPNVSRVDADVVLAIDCSSSMFSVDKYFLRRSASKAFIGKLDPARDKIGIVLWNDNVFDISLLSNNFQLANQTLDRIPNPDAGGTDYDAALESSLNLLSASPRADDRHVSHSVIFLTDANEEDSPQGISLNRSTISYAADRGYRIYMVGLDPYILSEPVLKEIAVTTNALYIKATDENSLLPIYLDLSKIIPYEILATNTTIVDILPPYLEAPRSIDYSPKNYIYTHNGSETLVPLINTYDKTKTIIWNWGIVPANGVPLTLYFKTKFVQPLPVDIVAGKERTKFNSQLTYVDSQGILQEIQINAGALLIKAKGEFSKKEIVLVSSGASVFSIGLGLPIWTWIQNKRRRQKKSE